MLFQVVKNTANYLSQQRHHIEVIVDKAKLNIKADVLVNMTSCRVRFCAENRTNFKNTFKNANHYLLIKLRTLRQISSATKVFNRKYIRSAFGRCANQFRRLNFGKVAVAQCFAEASHHAR